MNRDQTYLIHILERIERIEEYTKNGKEKFMQSRQIQDAVIRNFEVIGEVAKRISTKLKHKFSQISWKKVAGFRDILIHDYDLIIAEEVWDIIHQHLPKLSKETKKILEQVLKENGYVLGENDSKFGEKRGIYNAKQVQSIVLRARRKKSK